MFTTVAHSCSVHLDTLRTDAAVCCRLADETVLQRLEQFIGALSKQ